LSEYDAQVIHTHKGVKAVPSKSAAATTRSRYMEQAASDLEDNRRRQHDLARQIEALREEEKLLLDILSLAEHATTMPEQAQGLEEQPGAPTGSRPAGQHPRKQRKGAGSRRGPLLGDLLVGLLEEHREPRLAKELREEFLSRHPERTPTPQVVRNTLEGLVAKGVVERRKQQRSVMYTLVKKGQK
jgi:hypothetical protein